MFGVAIRRSHARSRAMRQIRRRCGRGQARDRRRRKGRRARVFGYPHALGCSDRVGFHRLVVMLFVQRGGYEPVIVNGEVFIEHGEHMGHSRAARCDRRGPGPCRVLAHCGHEAFSRPQGRPDSGNRCGRRCRTGGFRRQERHAGAGPRRGKTNPVSPRGVGNRSQERGGGRLATVRLGLADGAAEPGERVGAIPRH